MDTTTNEGGSQGEQPTTEAVDADKGAQVIGVDENGTPALEPSQESADSKESQEAATEAPGQETEEAQAPVDELDKFAKAKGFDPNALTEGERKALEMARNAEKKMHETTQSYSSSIEPPEYLAETGDVNVDPIVERQNILEQRQYVRDWFDANPDMKDHRMELQQIAADRPWLHDMDDVKAHFLANPSREAQLKNDGGREALENLAQKQQQVPPGATATNSGVYESSDISPRNVYELIEKNDQAWFEKNYTAINKAIAGK